MPKKPKNKAPKKSSKKPSKKIEHRIPVFIAVRNRPQLVQQSLHSLENSNIPDYLDFVIHDDKSTDHRMKDILQYCNLPNLKIEFEKTHRGPSYTKTAMIKKHIGQYSGPYFIITDSDISYQQDWFYKLHELYARLKTKYKISMITAFGTNVHPVEKKFKDYAVKRSIGGANVLVSREFYNAYCNETINKSYDWRWVERSRKNGYTILATIPSYVQHEGKHGANSSGRKYDTAPDFVGKKTKAPLIPEKPKPTHRKNINSKAYWDSRLRKGVWPRREHAYKLILQNNLLKGATKILNLGCATGDGYQVLAKKYSKADLHGADWSSVGIRHAVIKYPEQNYFVHDMLTDKLDDAYSHIIIIQSLQHLPTNPSITIEKYRKYCKKLIISVPNEKSISDKEHLWEFSESCLDYLKPMKVINCKTHLLFVFKGKLYKKKKSTNYKNKKWIKEQLKTKTPKQIAEECGVSIATIVRWEKKYKGK